MPGDFWIYVALVDPVDTSWNSAYLRNDLQMLSLEGEQKEGAFATLSIVVRNPYEGLLADGRKQWGWFTYKEGTEIIPFFFGQLVALPDDTEAEKITLKFIAKPLDYVSRLATAAAALKARPFYDPIFIRAELRDDPNTVLEGYPARWHIDRVTHAVSASHILEGEDGVEDFLESDGFYNSFSSSTVRNPVNEVDVAAAVSWTQSATGRISYTLPPVASYTGESIFSSWPRAGNLSGGWTVEASAATDQFNAAQIQQLQYHLEFHNPMKKHRDGDIMSITADLSKPDYRGPTAEFVIENFLQVGIVGNASFLTGLNIPAVERIKKIIVPKWIVGGSMQLRYDAARKRTERIALTLTADLQPLLTRPESPETSERETITLQGADVGIAIDGEIPLVDLSLSSFFPTDRGLQAVEYAISVGRARLLYGARVRELTRGIHFKRALSLSCRQSGRIYDHRIGGGVALGKIVAYKFSANVTKGRRDGSVTIGCAIGNGGAISGSLGDCDYIDDDYIDPGYFTRSGALAAFPSSDIGYAPPIAQVADDGLVFPLRADQVITTTITGSAAAQLAYMNAAPVGDITLARTLDDQQAAQDAVRNYLQAVSALPVKVEIRIKPVADQSFENLYSISTTELVVPQQIDLAAPAAP